MRTSSTDVRCVIISAISTSASVGVPKLNPFTNAFSTASRIAGCALPWIIGPHEFTRST